MSRNWHCSEYPSSRASYGWVVFILLVAHFVPQGDSAGKMRASTYDLQRNECDWTSRTDLFGGEGVRAW
eukprot:scaffold148191_cov31-Attheya_sp.AAC.1